MATSLTRGCSVKVTSDIVRNSNFYYHHPSQQQWIVFKAKNPIATATQEMERLSELLAQAHVLSLSSLPLSSSYQYEAHVTDCLQVSHLHHGLSPTQLPLCTCPVLLSSPLDFFLVWVRIEMTLHYLFYPRSEMWENWFAFDLVTVCDSHEKLIHCVWLQKPVPVRGKHWIELISRRQEVKHGQI